MKVTAITLLYEAGVGFDAGSLHDFGRDHDVIACDNHHFTGPDGPALCLVLQYRDRAKPAEWQRPAGQAQPSSLEIAPEDQPIYDALRKWRGERARKDGKPHYLYLRNPAMAEIAHKRPLTLAALGEIAGVGEAKLASFGQEILAIVRALLPAQPPDSAAQTEATDGE